MCMLDAELAHWTAIGLGIDSRKLTVQAAEISILPADSCDALRMVI